MKMMEGKVNLAEKKKNILQDRLRLLQHALDTVVTANNLKLSEHPVLVLVPVQCRGSVINDLKVGLYQQLKVSSLCVRTGHELAGFAAGRFTSLVVDVGHAATTIVPVTNGVPNHALARRLVHLGSHHAHQVMLEHFRKTYDSFGLMSLKIQEQCMYDIQERSSFVMSSKTQFANVSQHPRIARTYTTPDQDTLLLTKEMAMFGELYFQPDLNQGDNATASSAAAAKPSLHGVIADILVHCEPEMWQHVLLCGGTVKMPGFAERLTHELHLINKTAAVHFDPSTSDSRVWLGAAVASVLPDFTHNWEARWEVEAASVRISKASK
jgi:actin-related protein